MVGKLNPHGSSLYFEVLNHVDVDLAATRFFVEAHQSGTGKILIIFKSLRA
jgi:hypothetical protein